jgi:hypothetical protein
MPRTAKNSTSLAHRTVSGAPGWLGGELAALGNRRGDVAKNHRTVWWFTGLSGESEPPEPTVTSAISGRRVAHANGWLGTPDCPVCIGQCLVR